MNQFKAFLTSFLMVWLWPLVAHSNGETTSANMNLIVPAVGVTTGPQWASDINITLGLIDAHDHSPGKGVPVTPSGMSIISDLNFIDHNATNLRSVRFNNGSTTITTATDVGVLYEAAGDLYYNDSSGNVVRITQSGSVTGAAGTITGLPSGTASAVYSPCSGTFTFSQATNTAAKIDAASYVMRNLTANSKSMTIQPPSAMTVNSTITLPLVPGGSTTFLTIDTNGVIGTTLPTVQGLTSANFAPYGGFNITSNSLIRNFHWEYASIGSTGSACSSSPCTITTQSGTWLSSVTRASAGTYQLNIPNSIFGAAPSCTCSVSSTSVGICSTQTAGQNSVQIRTTASGSLTDTGFEVHCGGQI